MIVLENGMWCYRKVMREGSTNRWEFNNIKHDRMSRRKREVGKTNERWEEGEVWRKLYLLARRTWRTANRVRSGLAATPAATHMWGYRENKHCMCGAATCDLNHIMTSCTHFGEIPSKDDIAEMEGRAVRWMSAVADTV